MLLGEQIRAARAILKWRAADLAEKAGVNLSTVQRAEKADGPAPLMPANEKAIRSALEAAGVEFIPENGGGAGVRLKLEGSAV
ncbi:MAG TPA: transcriptional regulator [Roseomonas sp.]|nr:transcriptional regulator [Roseomonas sp.]